uniref:Putative transposase n=1 Tax=Lutzomyia longipalpis TaxID=7200 RepID=A0A1B0C8L0_LUTLO
MSQYKGAKCSVRNCRSIQNSEKDLSFHILSRKATKHVKEAWKKFAGGSAEYPVICSKHFVEDDFLYSSIYMKNYPNAKQKLKRNAIPSIKRIPTLLGRIEKKKRKNMKKVGDNLQNDSESSSSNEEIPSIEKTPSLTLDARQSPLITTASASTNPLALASAGEDLDILAMSTVPNQMDLVEMQEDEQEDNENLNQLDNVVVIPELSCTDVQENLGYNIDIKPSMVYAKTEERFIERESQKKLIGEIDRLKNQTTRLKEDKQRLQEKIADLKYKNQALTKVKQEKDNMEEALLQIFSQNELDLLLKRKSHVVWRRKEIQEAFLIRYLSKTCYRYLRTKKRYPLPSTAAIDKWVNRYGVRLGVLDDLEVDSD